MLLIFDSRSITVHAVKRDTPGQEVPGGHSARGHGRSSVRSGRLRGPRILFERALKKGKRVSVSLGVVSILASFLMLSLALLAVRILAAEKVLPFGCAMVAAFLLFWAVEAVRGWMAANGRL